MYYKDDFNVTFEEESAFYKYLDDVEKRAEWFRAQSKDLTVEAVTKDSTCTPIGNINLEYLKEDTINNSGLLIKTPDRSCFLGISAIKSLKGRARIDGKALAELDKETLAYILNKCLKVSRGKSLLRFCESKVRAVLSGDEKDYSILSMPEVYEIAGAYIYSDFEYASFKSGCADHNLVNATWELRDRRLTEAYKELLERYGKTFNGELYASVRMRHKNCKGTEDFNQNMASIFEYYKEALQEVLRLSEIWVNHPANAMIGVMKQAGFSKKLIAETVERFRAAAGDVPCSAYEIYCGICDVISIARQQETNARGLLLLEEKVAACVSKRWHELDMPGEIKY